MGCNVATCHMCWNGNADECENCPTNCVSDCEQCHRCHMNPPMMHPATTANNADPCFDECEQGACYEECGMCKDGVSNDCDEGELEDCKEMCGQCADCHNNF